MAELKDVCEASSPAAIAADATTAAATGTPAATSDAAPAQPAIAESVAEAAQVESSQVETLKIETSQAETLKVETTEAPKAEGPNAEALRVEAKMPAAEQLDPATTPAAPPIFLREHEQRVRPRAPASKVKATPGSARETKPKSRFGLLAATLAFSAGLGAAAGAVGVPLVAQTFRPATAAAPVGDATAEAQAIKGMIAQLTTDVSALRTAVEQSGKVSVPQVGKLAERLDRIERAQAEPAAKLAKIGEAIERLERRAQVPAPAAAQPAAAANDVTGTISKPAATPVEAKPKPTIIEEYVVRKVFDGVALVEGRRGIIEVEPGMSLPGAGRVEEIRRQDGRWVVVTNKGLILSTR